MWHKHLDKHWRKTKSFIHQGYTRLHGWAGEVERAAGIGKRIFALAAPILEEFGGGQAVSQGMRAIEGYDRLRQGMMDADAVARRVARPIAEADIF